MRYTDIYWIWTKLEEQQVNEELYLKKAHSRGHIVAIFSLVSNTAWRNHNTKQAKWVNDNLLPLSLNNYANTSEGGI